jgi:hypothetical protein
MNHTIDLLKPAARSATDVASLIDAARVLTFRACARARERAADPNAWSLAQVVSLYDTAARLSLQARMLVAETQRLLSMAPAATADDSMLQLSTAKELDSLHALLVAAMHDASRALDTLESLQELGSERMHAAPLQTPASLDVADVVQRLIERIKR